jgi:hypothetical protein
MAEMIFFKIRNKNTGLYSRGGSYPTWSKLGKVWKRRCDLSSHFTNIGAKAATYYADAEVIEIIVTETEMTAVPAIEYVNASKERAEKRKLESEMRVAQWRVSEAEREIARLKKIIENGGK